jgi:hypothetical protein
LLGADVGVVQDRYAGDVGDFFKLGLLRWLTAPSPFVQPLRLGVIWSGTGGESSDLGGTDVAYLNRTSVAGQDLRPLDPHLHDCLGRLVASGDRSIRALVSSGALPADTVACDRELSFADLSPNDPAAHVVRKERWFHSALVAVDPCSLVSIDADNALHHGGRAASWCRDLAEKHALSEVRQLLERGQSVVASHRVDPGDSDRGAVMASVSAVCEALGVEPLAVVWAPRDPTRLFTVIPAAAHRSDLEASLGALQLSSWGDELRLHRWKQAVVTV